MTRSRALNCQHTEVLYAANKHDTPQVTLYSHRAKQPCSILKIVNTNQASNQQVSIFLSLICPNWGSNRTRSERCTHYATKVATEWPWGLNVYVETVNASWLLRIIYDQQRISKMLNALVDEASPAFTA